MSKATTLSCGEAVRIGNVTVTYASHGGNGEIVLHFATVQEIAVLKRDGSERIISKSKRTLKLEQKIALDSGG